MMINPSIFKAYDIRGVVGAGIDADMARSLGLAFAALSLSRGEARVAVGRDGRLSGPQLQAALVDGLLAGGVDVVDIGAVTTPMLYFAASTVCSSGIQVTGSHNPRDHNGFKMVVAGAAIYGEDIQTLHRAMASASSPSSAPSTAPSSKQEPSPNPNPNPTESRGSKPEATERAAPVPRRGQLVHLNVAAPYSARILSDVRLARRMKVVVDCGNGIAGATAPALLRALGCEVVALFDEVDGRFPNHHPDPSKPENLRDLIAAVAAHGAELGLAFDGDGDRLGIVTRDGQNIFPDRQMMLFARDVLTRVSGGTIVFDVKCSQQLAPAVRAAGGVPLMSRTGHSLIKAHMRALRAQGLDVPLGGEMSGHIFFAERWFGFDDGTYAAARLLEILSRSADPSAVLNALPQSHATPEINVACAEGEAHRLAHSLVEQALANPAALGPEAALCTVDGLRIDWPDGFGLIRASNTTPVLVLRFEGQTEAALQRVRSAMLALLYRVKPDARLGEAAH